MEVLLSPVLRDDVHETIRQVVLERSIVNVSRLAEQIRRRNVADNVAREDIEAYIVMFAQTMSASMEFEPAADIPVAQRSLA